MTEPFAGVRKLSYYLPLGKGECGGCGKPILYNETIQVLEHEEPNPDCPRAWVKVQRTPEELERVRVAEAEAEAEDKANRERHTWLLTNAPHPILRALVEAHSPASDERYPACATCPSFPSEIDGDPVHEDWPCPVWLFISERMEGP